MSMIINFLLEAGENRDPSDPAQGLVLLNLAQQGHVYGWVETVSEDGVRLERVRKVTPNTLEPITDEYMLTIGLRHIIAARYADLNEIPKAGRF